MFLPHHNPDESPTKLVKGRRGMPTLFLVTDIETSLKERLAFDIAWNFIDRTGHIYSHGSYLATDVVARDIPYFKEKLGFYYRKTYDRLLEPLPIHMIRTIYNRQIANYTTLGYRVIFCAYNAKFDTVELGKTSMFMLNQPWLDSRLPMLCIWHYWSLSCPRTYSAEISDAGNIKTTAEDVYKFELKQPEFVEDHIAYSDVMAESEILVKVLRRKKPLPLVYHPDFFNTRPWKIANDRVNKKAA